MPSAREQTNMMKEELERIQKQISDLKVQEALLQRMLRQMGDKSVKKTASNRALGVKAAVLNFLLDAEQDGASAEEVTEAINSAIPNVADNTVRSVLSRLKSDGVLQSNNGRYYVREHAPQAPGLAVISR